MNTRSGAYRGKFVQEEPTTAQACGDAFVDVCVPEYARPHEGVDILPLTAVDRRHGGQTAERVDLVDCRFIHGLDGENIKLDIS